MTRAARPSPGAGKTLLGAPAGDTAQLARRLHRRWNPRDTLSAFKLKVEDYTNRLGPLDGGAKTSDMELEILQRVVEEGEQALKLHESEVATVEVLKTGMREFIDYALDEVDRFTRVTKLGCDDTFHWRAQGHPDTIPPLRRSRAENNVSDDMPHEQGSLAVRPQDLWRPYSRLEEAAITRNASVGDSTTGWSVGEGRFSVV